MEIKNQTVKVVLDKEERDNMVNTISLLEEMRSKINCEECPFKERCDKVSQSECLLYILSRDLKYINNNCDLRELVP